MKTSTRCCVRAAVLAVVFAAPNTAVAAQGDISVTAGSGVYASDAFCLDTDAFFSVFELSGGGDLVGGSVAYSNGAWPWLPPPTGVDAGSSSAKNLNRNRGAPRSTSTAPRSAQPEAFLTNGDAVRILVETFPVALLSRLPGQGDGALGGINRYVRPFIGAGVHISGDGTAAPIGTNGRDHPTFGLEGSTSFVLSYGARVYLPGRNMPIRAVVLYRGNTMFVSDVVYRTPDNGTLRRDGETLTWGEWGIGLSLRIGS